MNLNHLQIPTSSLGSCESEQSVCETNDEYHLRPECRYERRLIEVEKSYKYFLIRVCHDKCGRYKDMSYLIKEQDLDIITNAVNESHKNDQCGWESMSVQKHGQQMYRLSKCCCCKTKKVPGGISNINSKQTFVFSHGNESYHVKSCGCSLPNSFKVISLNISS